MCKEARNKETSNEDEVGQTVKTKEVYLNIKNYIYVYVYSKLYD